MDFAGAKFASPSGPSIGFSIFQSLKITNTQARRGAFRTGVLFPRQRQTDTQLRSANVVGYRVVEEDQVNLNPHAGNLLPDKGIVLQSSPNPNQLQGQIWMNCAAHCQRLGLPSLQSEMKEVGHPLLSCRPQQKSAASAHAQTNRRPGA
jgi:hypothetical protein